MSVHVLLNLLNEFLFAAILINSIMQEHFYHMTVKMPKNCIFGVKTSRFSLILRNVKMDVITFPENL